MHMRPILLHQMACTALVFASLMLAPSANVLAADPFPQVSPEGLQLQKDTTLRAVYLKPGASFAAYKRVAILDCFVQFAKDFQQDYNEDEMGMGEEITTRQMTKITTGLATEFKTVFTQELQANGGYPVVNFGAADVLILRPAIINLVVTAPDLMTANMSVTVVASAGQMTLYLELYDSLTNTLLARIIDPEADASPMAEVASSVTNKMAADRILRRWADMMRKHLDAVQTQIAVTPAVAPAN